MDGSEFNNHLQFTPFISIINYFFLVASYYLTLGCILKFAFFQAN